MTRASAYPGGDTDWNKHKPDSPPRRFDYHFTFEDETLLPPVLEREISEQAGRKERESCLPVLDGASGRPCNPKIRNAIREVPPARAFSLERPPSAHDQGVGIFERSRNEGRDLFRSVLAVRIKRNDSGGTLGQCLLKAPPEAVGLSSILLVSQ